MENNNIIKALATIKDYCKNRDMECESCPFCIDNKWAVDCMFCGPHFGEGVIPEDWDLNSLNLERVNKEVHS